MTLPPVGRDKEPVEIMAGAAEAALTDIVTGAEEAGLPIAQALSEFNATPMISPSASVLVV